MMNATTNQIEPQVTAVPAPVIDRTAHNGANFQPEQYEVLDYLDNRPPRFSDFVPYSGLALGNPTAYNAAMEQARQEHAAALAHWTATMDRYFPDRRNQNPSIHKCTHCGNTQVRYICAVKHRPTGHVVVFGDVCVERLSFANHDAFRAAQVRAKAAQGNANLVVFRRREEFLANNPAFATILNDTAELTHPCHAQNTFAQDIVAKFAKYGSLSVRQVECFVQSMAKDHERARQAAERAAQEEQRRTTAQPAPEGRMAVVGQVVGLKQHGDELNGFVWKMTVLLDTGAKVWMTVPSGMYCDTLRGSRVSVTATFTRSQNDQTFAFGKRPSKWEILPTA